MMTNKRDRANRNSNMKLAVAAHVVGGQFRANLHVNLGFVAIGKSCR